VLPTPNNLERARLVGDSHDLRLHAHTGRTVAVDGGAGAFVPPFPMGYMKGSAAWDIGQIQTRHSIGRTRARNGSHGVACARIIELRRSALKSIPAEVRLNKALAIPCTCGAGNSMSEQSSKTNKENTNNEHPTIRASSFYV
jgi:hypothetical protein